MVLLQLNEMLQKYTEGCNHNYTTLDFFQISLTNILLVTPFCNSQSDLQNSNRQCEEAPQFNKSFNLAL